MDQDTRRGKTFALAITALLIVTGSGMVIYINDERSPGEDHILVPHYDIPDPTLVERFDKISERLNVTATGSAQIDQTPVGLKVIFQDLTGLVRITAGERCDCLVLLMNTTDVMKHPGSAVGVTAVFNISNNIYYKIYFNIGFISTNITYEFNSGPEVVSEHHYLLRDATRWTSLMIDVNEGSVTTGIDGIEQTMVLPRSNDFTPSLDRLSLEALGDVSLGRPLHVSFIKIGGNGSHVFNDILHKTIVPDGKDFAFTFIIHADRAYPEQLLLMANLSQEYGILGTYDAWVNGTDRFYGMSDPEFRDAMHVLQGSGWDLGLHAVGTERMTREQIIMGIERFTEEFGPPRSWSDHAFLEQDLAVQGSNVSSTYYTADIVEDIGMGWAHAWHGTSYRNDLNSDGLSYRMDGMEGVPLYRVSRSTGWDFYGTIDGNAGLDQRLGSWPMERSLIVVHDYFAYLFYASNGTGNYSVLPKHDGIDLFPWSQLNPKKILQDAEWSVLPRFQAFLNWTDGYDVWFAPLRDVYDRGDLVQKVSVREYNDRVVICNPTDSRIEGLTLFTASEPNYYLGNGDANLWAGKGTASSWHFVIDVGPGEILVLKKGLIKDLGRTGPWDLPADNFELAMRVEMC